MVVVVVVVVMMMMMMRRRRRRRRMTMTAMSVLLKATMNITAYRKADGAVSGLIVEGHGTATVEAVHAPVHFLLPGVAVEVLTAHGPNQEVTHHVHLLFL